jgi:uncharacterized membrane protein
MDLLLGIIILFMVGIVVYILGVILVGIYHLVKKFFPVLLVIGILYGFASWGKYFWLVIGGVVLLWIMYISNKSSETSKSSCENNTAPRPNISVPTISPKPMAYPVAFTPDPNAFNRVITEGGSLVNGVYQPPGSIVFKQGGRFVDGVYEPPFKFDPPQYHG